MLKTTIFFRSIFKLERVKLNITAVGIRSEFYLFEYYKQYNDPRCSFYSRIR